jgi:hypothetical protein
VIIIRRNQKKKKLPHAPSVVAGPHAAIAAAPRIATPPLQLPWIRVPLLVPPALSSLPHHAVPPHPRAQSQSPCRSTTGEEGRERRGRAVASPRGSSRLASRRCGGRRRGEEGPCHRGGRRGRSVPRHRFPVRELKLGTAPPWREEAGRGGATPPRREEGPCRAVPPLPREGARAQHRAVAEGGGREEPATAR